MGYFHVSEKSLQDADPRQLQLPLDVPPTAMGHNQEPILHPNSAWVIVFHYSVRPQPDSLIFAAIVFSLVAGGGYLVNQYVAFIR
jgi:hypothetical protein